MKKLTFISIFILSFFFAYSQYAPGALDFNYPTAVFTPGVDYTGTDSNGNGYLNYDEIVLDPNAPSGPNYHLYDVLATGKPVIIDFYSPSCHWCRTYTPIIDSLYLVHGPSGDNKLDIVGVCSYNTYGYEGYKGLYYFWESVVNSSSHPLMTDFPSNPQVSDATEDAGVFDTAPYYITGWPKYIVVCPDRTWRKVEDYYVEVQGDQYYGGEENLSDSLYAAACDCDPIATETNDALIYDFASPEGKYVCNQNITPAIKLQSRGTSALTSVDIIEKVNGTEQTTYHWTGNINQYDITDVTLNAITLSPGNNTIEFIIQNPNGAADENTSNDIFTKNVVYAENSTQVTVTFDFDYVTNQDFSWRIEEENTHEVIFEKSFDNSYGYSTDVQNVCLMDDKCYDFVFVSNKGYGINGNPSSESLVVTDENNTELVHLDKNNAIGPGGPDPFIVTTNFCVGNPTVDINKTAKFEAYIYPNTGNGNINLHIPNNTGNISVKVIDILGNVIYENNNTGKGKTFNFNIYNAKSGIYNIIVSDAKNRKVIKYIKLK